MKQKKFYIWGLALIAALLTACSVTGEIAGEDEGGGQPAPIVFNGVLTPAAVTTLTVSSKAGISVTLNGAKVDETVLEAVIIPSGARLNLAGSGLTVSKNRLLIINDETALIPVAGCTITNMGIVAGKEEMSASVVSSEDGFFAKLVPRFAETETPSENVCYVGTSDIDAETTFSGNRHKVLVGTINAAVGVNEIDIEDDGKVFFAGIFNIAERRVNMSNEKLNLSLATLTIAGAENACDIYIENSAVFGGINIPSGKTALLAYRGEFDGELFIGTLTTGAGSILYLPENFQVKDKLTIGGTGIASLTDSLWIEAGCSITLKDSASILVGEWGYAPEAILKAGVYTAIGTYFEFNYNGYLREDRTAMNGHHLLIGDANNYVKLGRIDTSSDSGAFMY
ncbi:MAG: hypothetical protein LBV52_05205, partial [Spirochaetaceae bacterium]|nr:hypothetical protein [Spirochaetaceae bacterium]